MALVWIPSLLQGLSGGARSAQVPGTTLREALDELDALYPGFKARLLDEDGRLRPELAVAIDGETQHLGMLEPLTENTEVQFIPAISGG